MINRFDRTSAKNLSREIESALLAVAQKHNITIKSGSGSYNASSFSLKVVCRSNNTDIANDTMAPILRRMGLPTNAIGRTFEYKGDAYTIMTINTRKRRYPVETRKASTGSILNFDASTVVRLLGTETIGG